MPPRKDESLTQARLLQWNTADLTLLLQIFQLPVPPHANKQALAACFVESEFGSVTDPLRITAAELRKCRDNPEQQTKLWRQLQQTSSQLAAQLKEKERQVQERVAQIQAERQSWARRDQPAPPPPQQHQQQEEPLQPPPPPPLPKQKQPRKQPSAPMQQHRAQQGSASTAASKATRAPKAAEAAPESNGLHGAEPAERRLVEASGGGDSSGEAGASAYDAGRDARLPCVLLGVCGHVTTNEQVPRLVARLLEFATVKVVCTPAVEEFAPSLLEQLEQHGVEVYGDEDRRLFMQTMSAELCKQADLLIVAPLSTDTLGDMANGLVTNLLTHLARHWEVEPEDGKDTFAPLKPFLAVPALPPRQMRNPITTEHWRKLRERGVSFVGGADGAAPPLTDAMAADVETIVQQVQLKIAEESNLCGYLEHPKRQRRADGAVSRGGAATRRP